MHMDRKRVHLSGALDGGPAAATERPHRGSKNSLCLSLKNKREGERERIREGEKEHGGRIEECERVREKTGRVYSTK